MGLEALAGLVPLAQLVVVDREVLQEVQEPLGPRDLLALEAPLDHLDRSDPVEIMDR